MSEVLIVGIIAAVVCLLTPALGWFLNQQGVSRQAKELEALKSRLDLIDRLGESKASIPMLDNDIEQLRIREIRAVLAEINSFTEVARAGSAPNEAKLNRWSRTFLSYDQISLKGRIYKGLFYAFTILSVTGTAVAVSVAASNEWVFSIVGGAFYLFIGYLFRRAAIRAYNADKKKAVATQVDC